MKERVLFIQSMIIYKIHSFLGDICHKLSDKHHELYIEIMALRGNTDGKDND